MLTILLKLCPMWMTPDIFRVAHWKCERTCQSLLLLDYIASGPDFVRYIDPWCSVLSIWNCRIDSGINLTKWVNRLGETTIIISRICNSLPPSIYQWSLIHNNPWKLISEILLTTIRSALEWMVLLSGTTRVVPAVARPLAAGTASAVPDSSTNHDSAGRISGQCLFYRDHNFIKS